MSFLDGSVRPGTRDGVRGCASAREASAALLRMGDPPAGGPSKGRRRPDRGCRHERPLARKPLGEPIKGLVCALLAPPPSVILRHPQSVYWGSLSQHIGAPSVSILGLPQSAYWGSLNQHIGSPSISILGLPQSVYWGSLSQHIGAPSVSILGLPQSAYWGPLSQHIGAPSVSILGLSLGEAPI
jgi:hypothetical protein